MSGKQFNYSQCDIKHVEDIALEHLEKRFGVSKEDSLYPKIFITGKIENSDERSLCADALCGWACCMAGFDPPKNFCIGMEAIGEKLGVPSTPNSLERFAIDRGWLNEQD